MSLKNTVADDEALVEETPKDKKSLLIWIKTHQKELIPICISIPIIIAVVFGLKNKDTIKALWGSLNKEIKKANMYSNKWFETVTDDTLSSERENVRLAYCSSGDNFNEASKFQNLLWRFDKEMSKRAWGDEIPHAPGVHREHGWYLPNDD